MKTYSMKLDEIEKDWLMVDADDIPLGRLATHVATFLRGKHKPTFTAHLDMGDNVIVLNAAKVKLTGAKRENKVYLSHTGYMGGQRVTTMASLMEKRPEEVILRAVKGMLQVADGILYKRSKPEAAAKIYRYLLAHCSPSPFVSLMQDGLKESEKRLSLAV